MSGKGRQVNSKNRTYTPIGEYEDDPTLEIIYNDLEEDFNIAIELFINEYSSLIPNFMMYFNQTYIDGWRNK